MAAQFESIASAFAIFPATTVVVPKPAGTAQGDLLIAWGMGTGSGAWTPPAGWTKAFQKTNNVREGFLANLVAGSSEPADYTFTFSGTDTFIVAIMRVSGNDPLNPIDAEQLFAQTDSSPPSPIQFPCPPINTTKADTLIICLDMADRGGAIITGTPDRPGFTERLDVNATPGFQTSIRGYTKDAIQAAPGATGATETVIILHLPDSGTHTGFVATLAIAPVPQTPQVENASGLALSGVTSLPIPKPAGLVVGEVMVGVVSHGFFGALTTPPAGWTKVGSDFISPVAGIRATLAFKIADAADVAASTFTFTRTGVGAEVPFVGGILRISGIDTSAPINVSLFFAETSPLFGTTVLAPDVVTTVNGALLIRVGIGTSGLVNIGTFSMVIGSAAYTERVEVSAVGSRLTGLAMYTINLNQPLAGATGTELLTASGLSTDLPTGTEVTGLTIAIAPAGPPPGAGPPGGFKGPFRLLARRWRVLGTGA